MTRAAGIATFIACQKKSKFTVIFLQLDSTVYSELFSFRFTYGECGSNLFKLTFCAVGSDAGLLEAIALSLKIFAQLAPCIPLIKCT